MLFYAKEYQVSWLCGGSWPHQDGLGEGEGHPRMEDPCQYKETTLVSWVIQLLQMIH